ncbi:MAG: hypothetical protein MK384_08010 [SAR202 cluster bacterium]|nr:hypothetical protein [SAR202 cluster bacterium]
MSNYPRPIEAGNDGDGSPLVLGDEQLIGDLHSPCDPTNVVHVFDCDGDNKLELVCSGNEIFSYKFIDTLPDGSPIVDRGLRWGTMSRAAHRNSCNEGLTGYIAAIGDFSGDGPQIIVSPRYYSQETTVAISEVGGLRPTKEGALHVSVDGTEDQRHTITRGTAVPIDWDNDGRLDLITVDTHNTSDFSVDPATGVAAEDQRYRYARDGSWLSRLPKSFLHLYQNVTEGSNIHFSNIGSADVELPMHTKWATLVNPNDPSAGLLLLTYYGRLLHLPILETGRVPTFGDPTELLTLHGEPFNRNTTLNMSITVADPLENGRFDIFAGDHSQAIGWSKYYGQDENNRPIYDTPKKIKQRNPHVANSFFSVPTTGDWRDTGVPDLLVGGVEGHIYWYKTLSTEPLRFSLPERVRNGTTEIRRLARPNPAAGHDWGGSQSPYDGDIGGYSNPVLVDWNNNGLLDLMVSDMIGLFEWYPNWGTKKEPELGPPQRVHIQDGEALRGPWRQKPGIGHFSNSGVPDIVIQDNDLDLAIFRRLGREHPSIVKPGEKLRFDDGEVIKTHGVYTPGGGDGRGRTKINVVDWDKDGLLDLLIGVGPQHGSPFSSYVLFLKNVGTNTSPVFKRPDVVLWDSAGEPLEFWRHGVHPDAVDFDGDGEYELLAGADQGRIWYWKPSNFGTPVDGNLTAPYRPTDDPGLGKTT